MRKIIYNQFGNSSNLSIQDQDIPKPTSTEIVVEVKAASINPIDWKLMNGAMTMMSGKKFPKGIGCDFSGVINSTGSGVKGLKVGDEVFGWMPYKNAGSYAEYVQVSADLVVKKPSSVNFSQAACLPMVGGAALVALKEKGGLAVGKEVLVNGCVGGVGHVGTQIAKALGAKVTGICGANDLTKAKELGADQVLDYKRDNVLKSGQQFDIVFDTVGNLNYKECKAILKKNGKFLDLNPTGLMDILHGSFSSTYKVVMASVEKKHLVELADFAENKGLRPIIGKTISLDETIETIGQMEKGARVPGKTVIEIR